MIKPEYIFETSWEVCNPVGGIYTVLSTRAKTLQKEHKDKVIFIGPDFWKDKPNPLFKESKTLLKEWVKNVENAPNYSVRVGRWQIPGKPIAVLIDFKPEMHMKNHFQNKVYELVWSAFGVDSLNAYGDYHEASLFSVASGAVIKSLFEHFKLSEKNNVIAHFNEWTTSFGLLYIKHFLPSVATVFTTHATSIGRSIAGNGKPLYNYLSAYNGDQMARELNMEAKHSAEKTAAHLSDCFTTVSDITAAECKQLLEKSVDVVTPNGFEDDFVPQGKEAIDKRENARERLTVVAEALLGYELEKDALYIGTCGRYEYKNKGLDAFVDALNRLRHDKLGHRQIIGFVMVPAYSKGPRADLQAKLAKKTNNQLPNNYITHDLYDSDHDPITNAVRWYGMNNSPESRVKIIFVPSYLNGVDGIFNMSYYDLLIGLDLTAFPSYYEPWGYTPLESIAFGIPTITTCLSGFGVWADKMGANKRKYFSKGVIVLDRDDYNYNELVEEMKLCFHDFSLLDKGMTSKISNSATKLSKKALWENFICYYYTAYDIALKKAKERVVA
jgi:glycogen synthase